MKTTVVSARNTCDLLFLRLLQKLSKRTQ